MERAKKMSVIYDSGWVKEPDDNNDNKYDRYDNDNYVFNEYCVEHYRKQHKFQYKYVTITVRGAVVYTVVVMMVAALVTVLLLDII